ncbi:MAG TPA: LPS assembly protein LptD [Stellaceae bacterium]|nr:LPS assembly protein LptD [Stellaceae bacterium]
MRGLAVLCLSAVLATAAVPAVAAGPERTTSGSPILFSADEVQYDDELGLVVAKGHVEISQNDQTLLADTVTYNQRTDTVTASGHVSLLQPTGDVIFADFVELHDDLREGFIRNLRMLLSDRSRVAGNTARRVEGNRIEIRRGVYSPCEPCREDPTRAPIWQIKAEEIISDKQQKIVEYRDAFMEIDGIPVFYTPYFSHPDPSVKRQSGFLAPSIGNSSNNGFHVSIPYYWVIDKDKDATFRPMFTTGGGQYLGTEYRQRFSNGELTTDGSITVGSKASTALDTAPESGVRGHLFATGELDLTDDWRTGLNIQRTSDQTYLLRYHIPSPTTFLTSQLYGERFTAQSYANISAWSFQSLRAGTGDSIQPIVAPVADYNWVSQPDPIGGRLSVEGNALNLARIQGIDMRRLSLGSEWRLPFKDPIGQQYLLSLSLRGDGYHSDNLPTGIGNGTESRLAGRAFPQFAFTWRYPWVRHGDGARQVIEPIAMFAAAPRGENPFTIPNEDSQGFEFDETSLFRRNRFPGFDRVDGGERVDYGIRAGYYSDKGGSTRLLVGQSYDWTINPNFLPGSGLDHRQSDVVGRVTLSPNPYLDLVYRFRLDHADLALRRQEISGTVGPSNLRLGLSYLQIAAIPSIQLPSQRQISATLSAQLTRYWSMQLLETRNLGTAPVPVTATGTPLTTVGTTQTLNSGIALTYRDECVAFITSLTQSGIVNGDVKPGTSLVFTIVFKNLGDIGSTLATF